jgi:hypothetical protein
MSNTCIQISNSTRNSLLKPKIKLTEQCLAGAEETRIGEVILHGTVCVWAYGNVLEMNSGDHSATI